jgi:ABC-type glycerol-3-phosphate transport system substrate-binding protein
MHDPSQCDLFAQGLWMPVTADYYEDPVKTDAWLKGKTGVYPAEAKQVITEFVYRYSPDQTPVYTLKNQSQIFDEAVNPASSAIFANEKTAQVALDEAVKKAKPFMKGKWKIPG